MSAAKSRRKSSDIQSEWIEGVEGDFPLHKAVLDVLPQGTTIIAAETHGTSGWARPAKITVLSPENESKRYFIKCITGKGARAVTEGEYHSVKAMTAAAPGLVPEPVGWGTYSAAGLVYHFYVADYHDLNLETAPDPVRFAARISDFHARGTSPTGMFGFSVPTAIGNIEQTVTWDASWAKSFTRQLQNIIRYDNEANGSWPEFQSAVDHLIEAVIPRLLGTLQSEGRDIVPVLVHGDLWEHNVATDTESGEIIIFDLGCIYAHNEMEFGTWRCTWASHFSSPIYLQMYQRHIKPSEPINEWDDRNRLYSIYPYLVDSAGHPGSNSRRLAYNDILYLCEKYAPFDWQDKYDPDKDISVTKAFMNLGSISASKSSIPVNPPIEH